MIKLEQQKQNLAISYVETAKLICFFNVSNPDAE